MSRPTYAVTRAELHLLLEVAEDHGISRRQLLRVFAFGGFGALLAACERPPAPDASDTALHIALPWRKDPKPFIQHPTNLETRLELLDDVITPNELFFVRNHAPTPAIDASTWRLRIRGDSVDRAVEVGLEELESLPTESVVAYLECGGNWRSFWQPLVGRVANGGQWGTGGVSCATWEGPTLASVMELAGVQDTAVDVDLIGVDDGAFSRAMPLSRAMDPTTLVALRMNGDPLPADHGFPARAVVPGWVGSSSVKWLGDIVVTSEKVWSKNNTTSYVLIGDDWPADEHSPADGGPITTGVVKSALALPRPGRLEAGVQTVRGFAYAPQGPVSRVEWSADKGASWLVATILDPVLPYAWQRFELEWDAPAGHHTLITRATDAAGNTQPGDQPFNAKGYLLNIALPHDIIVT